MITSILASMQVHAIWIMIAIIMVTLAMVVDLLTGVRKAKRNGNATTSSGLRKTCEKAYKYYLPIICGSFFDFLFCQLSFYTLPFLAMFISAYCILCEMKSVIENTNQKEQVKTAVETITEMLRNKDNPEELLATVLNKLSEEKKD